DNEPAAEPAPPQKSWALVLAENAGPIMSGLTVLFTLGANMLYNSRLKPGETALAPHEAIARAAGRGPAPAAPHNGAAPTHYAAAPPAAAPTAADQWAAFMQEIEGPFISHFFSGETNGYTLAYFLQTNGTGASITAEGRAVYDTVKEKLGVKGL